MGARGTALATGAAIAAIAGCGGGETMSADEFLAEMEQRGVGIEVTNDELVTDDPDKDLRAIELERLPGSPKGPHPHGSLAVYDDVGGADEGLETCRGAADLLCYRAANVVVVLEAGGLEAQRLAVAMQMLAEE